MSKKLSSITKSYLAGFIDGDGSIYVRLKPNKTYRYNFQVVSHVVLFQSQKNQKKFEKICSKINLGLLRVRKDGIMEYVISKDDNVREFLIQIKPFLILKKRQADLMLEIIAKRKKTRNEKDFQRLVELVNSLRDLNYSKKR